MQISVRCTTVRLAPSDASGFIVDAEVADRTEIIRQAILEMTEAEIDNAFGKENADRAADAARHAIDRGLKQAALESRLAEVEKERDALSARVRELEGLLRPFVEPDVGLIGEPGTIGSVVTLQQFLCAARALKGEG